MEINKDYLNNLIGKESSIRGLELSWVDTSIKND